MPQVKRFPMGIPFGWFFVAYSDELAVGDVRPAHYFGRDLAIFRNEDGKAGVLDAYCPHMGAHLGYGGKVEGDSLRCPFHAWTFNPEGFCTDIPYAHNFPPRARREPLAGAYPVQEKNGVVWAWYHPKGEKPGFDVIETPEFTEEKGWAPRVKRLWRFPSNPQEIGENGVDVAHFHYVHEMLEVPEGKSSYEGHIRRSEAHGTRRATGKDGQEIEVRSSVYTIQNGAGQKITRIEGDGQLALQVLVTPIEADDVELRAYITHPAVEPGSFDERIMNARIEGLCGKAGIEGDIPIWTHKIHKSAPFLCDGDGQILRYRRYFEQFYADDDAAREQAKAAE